jgi:uncharacterized protein YcnI
VTHSLSSHTRPFRRVVQMPRMVAALIALVCAVLVLPPLAFGHAVVFPKSSTPGAYERYLLRVPNERNVPTTRVEIRFPTDVKVVSFADVQGWQLEVMRDSANRIVGATWTGSLAPERFIEFPFVAVNPKTSVQLRWPAYQTYSDGERVEWTGAEDAKAPASVTTISSATAAGAPASSNTPLLLAGGALLIAFVSLGLAMRRA